MSISLPKEFSYDVLESLPSGITNNELMLLPINGSTFSCANSGTIVQWTLPSVGFLQPDSLYLKYTYQTTSVGESQICGSPVYSPLQRMQTLFGSNIVENITNYNAINHMLTNVNLNPAQKWGLQQQYGYNNSSAAGYQVSNLQSMNGGVIPINGTGTWSCFLPCLLSNSEKLIPLCSMPSVTVQITLDSIANIFAPAAVAILNGGATGVLAQAACVLPTDFVLSNMTLCYNMITMPESLTSMLLKEDKIFIKSNSFINIQNFVNVGTSGQVELVYNTRLASVKTCFMLNSSNGVNKIFDSVDLSSGGDYIFSIAGRLFPSRPIASNGGILPELRKSVGSMGCKFTSFSIDALEMSYTASGAVLTTREAPAKIYPSINLSTVPFSDVLLSGISTQSSPISVRINVIVPTIRPITASLVMYYDAIIEIDTTAKMATVKQ